MNCALLLKGNRMLSRFKPKITGLLKPITLWLFRIGIRPNHLTALAVTSGLFSAYLIFIGKPFEGVFFLFISSALDALDGALARNQNLKSDFGGFLDSVMDRYVDAAVIISIGVYSGHVLLASIAVAGALMVSYARARAEQIIERCDVGIAERGERTLVLIAGLLSGFEYHSLLIVAVLAHLTAIHRIYYTYSQSR